MPTSDEAQAAGRSTETALVSLAQHLAGLTTGQDPWSEAEKALLSSFGADLAAFVDRRAGGEIIVRRWNFADPEWGQAFSRAGHGRLAAGSELAGAIGETLDSGQPAARLLAIPDPVALACLPVAGEDGDAAVMLVGHRGAGPIPERLLASYLAVAALAGTTAARLAAERGREEAQRRLEALVEKQTVERKSVDEQLQAVAALRESESRYRQVSELISDYAYVFRVAEDGSLQREWIVGGFEAITGYSPEDSGRGYDWSRLIHPEDLPLAVERAKRLLAGERDVSEFRIVRADGEIRWLRDHGRPVWDEEAGRVVRVYGAAQDITESERANSALRESEKRVQRLVEQQIAVGELALAVGESLDPDEIYHIIRKHVQDLMDVWYFVVSSYDEEAQLIRAEYAAAGQVFDVAAFPPIPLGAPDTGTQSRVIHSGQPLYVPDLRTTIGKSAVRYLVEENGSVHEIVSMEDETEETTRSAVYAPMKVKGKTIGILQVQSRQPDAYSAEDIELLSGIANVAAVAIQNARLHADVKRELAERERAEARLRSLLQEKELLLRELYHRTRNNMLVIQSYLELDATSRSSEEVQQLVRNTKNRIQTMALVHEKLYRSQHLSRISLDEYIVDLVHLLRSSFQPDGDHINLRFDTESIVVLIDIALPCGLIVDELVSNAFQHAFPRGRAGEIRVGLRRVGPGELLLEVADDGVGLPAGGDRQKTSSMGLAMVEAIARHQLMGELTIENIASPADPGRACGVRCLARIRDDLYSERV